MSEKKNIFLKRFIGWRIILVMILCLLAGEAWASGSIGAGAEAVSPAVTFLAIAIILVAAKASSLVEKIGQPAVLGELLIGVVLGNLALIGWHYFEAIKHNEFITFLAELGVVILLFQVGLESNIREMKKVGARAFLVASVGVVLPFALGAYIIGPLLLPGLSMNAYIFLGATLTATSVGITARVFRDLGKLQTSEAQIVLGAAVIDDVMGLIILAVVSAMVTVGAVSFGAISLITAKAVLFLAAAIFLGQLLAPQISKLFAKIHTGVGMKFTFAIAFGLVMAYGAHAIGLAPIVGAFAAGLVLDPVHFRYFKDAKMVDEMRALAEGSDEEHKKKIIEVIEPHAHRHIEDIIEPIGYFLAPIFFVLTGMAVKLETLFNFKVLLIALGITAVAFVGKLMSGLAAGKVNKWIVGWGMAPRGEVGLIFAAIGKALGVIDDQIFSVIVIVVILTTLLTPPILALVIKRGEK